MFVKDLVHNAVPAVSQAAGIGSFVLGVGIKAFIGTATETASCRAISRAHAGVACEGADRRTASRTEQAPTPAPIAVSLTAPPDACLASC